MNRKYMIISILLVLFIFFCIFIAIRIKSESSSENITGGVGESFTYNDDFSYDYDENTNQYIIYDNTGNIRGIAKDDYELDLYKYDKDYDPSLRPPGL